jgi:CRISPR-associated endonuclease Csy4
MNHYLDIQLLPDPEIESHFFMNTLFTKLHRALVQLGSRSLGVSFPDWAAKPPSLGERLRLHGTGQQLDHLMALDWLQGMRDHVRTQPPAPVPAGAAHCLVRRVQAKSNPERLRRRWLKRHGNDQAAAQAAFPSQNAERLDLPFVTIRSQSTGQTFRLFIEHGPPGNQPLPGGFSYYGLSATATVPWF